MSEQRIIIGIVGLAGSGKTLVARHLVEKHGFARSRFAAPLKEMIKVGLGLSDAHLDGELKNEPIPSCGGCTARHLMQTLGTEWGRRMVHSDIWVNRWREVVLADATRLVVVDDVRFPNEASAVKSVGGSIWRIVRPGLSSMDHPSERAQRNIQEDFLINNATTISEMIRSVDALVDNSRRAT
jgi:hypothetical protein